MYRGIKARLKPRKVDLPIERGVGIILLMEGEVVGGIKPQKEVTTNLTADREIGRGIKVRIKPGKVDLPIEGGLGGVGIILLMEGEVVGGIKQVTTNLAADREIGHGIKVRIKPGKVDLPIEGGLGGVGIILLVEGEVDGGKTPEISSESGRWALRKGRQ